MSFSSARRKSVSEFVKKRPNYPGLEDTFRAFCETKAGNKSSGFVEMDGKTFAKVFKDCGLMGNKKGQLSVISIDINFSKCKPKGERKIVYKDFLEAVHICATEMGLAYEELCEKIASSRGPNSRGPREAPSSPRALIGRRSPRRSGLLRQERWRASGRCSRASTCSGAAILTPCQTTDTSSSARRPA